MVEYVLNFIFGDGVLSRPASGGNRLPKRLERGLRPTQTKPNLQNSRRTRRFVTEHLPNHDCFGHGNRAAVRGGT